MKPRGVLTEAERQVIQSLFADDEQAESENQQVLSQLRGVLEQVDQSGLREQSLQIIEDVLGRAVARRHLTDDKALG